jgi:hypothetical protein
MRLVHIVIVANNEEFPARIPRRRIFTALLSPTNKTNPELGLDATGNQILIILTA